MNKSRLTFDFKDLRADAVAGLVVFLVALPLCLGVSLASQAPIYAGILSGVIGGVLVGFLSGSQTSVAGPAAGLTAVVALQIATLGSYENFLVAVVLAGTFQILFSVARVGFLSVFVPNSVINGLLAAIGIILIIKQIPHVLGHDNAAEGEMSFQQIDQQNSFSEIAAIFSDFSMGAAIIGLLSLALVFYWPKNKRLASSPIPSSLIAVITGIIAYQIFAHFLPALSIATSHLVQVPAGGTVMERIASYLIFPNFSALTNTPAVYTSGIVLAIVATLETVLNVEAVDKIDPQQRRTPINRELLAQGIGNTLCGLLGGIPVTSVIVRSSVNISAKNKSKKSTIMHGLYLGIFVLFFPFILNSIPLACLAAILLFTGYKLASPKLFTQMWRGGIPQFVPFFITCVTIVFTDILTGILVGLMAGLSFILYSNMRRPLQLVKENHLGTVVKRLELVSQVSFLSKYSVHRVLHRVAEGSHIHIDASHSQYIDSDVIAMLEDFTENAAVARNIQLSLTGLEKYSSILSDRILYCDVPDRKIQKGMTPDQIVKLLIEGNKRFLKGKRLHRDFQQQVQSTSLGQHPLAVVLSCIDSRNPIEHIFDLGLGDVFSIRIAGNVTSPNIIGSIEYACAVAGAKVIVVLGHTACGAVTTSVELASQGLLASQATPCQHLDKLLSEIQRSITPEEALRLKSIVAESKTTFVDEIAERNVENSMKSILEKSTSIMNLVREGKLIIVGGMYDVSVGTVTIENYQPKKSPPICSLNDESYVQI